MSRLEFPDPPAKPEKKVERLVFDERPTSKMPTPSPSSPKLFEDKPKDPNAAITSEVRAKYPHYSDQQVRYAASLLKQLTPLSEAVLNRFGIGAQEAQAGFVIKLAEHTKELQLDEVTKLVSSATEAASKKQGLLDKLFRSAETDWNGFRALAQHLKEKVAAMMASVLEMEKELGLQKDRLPIHLAALAMAVSYQVTTTPELEMTIDNRRRSLAQAVQQSMLLFNQVAQMKATVKTAEDALEHFRLVTLPALEMKSSLE